MGKTIKEKKKRRGRRRKKMLPCESYKVFKNIYFTEHLRQVTVSAFCIFFSNVG